jgi:16S rRNA (guanine1516-N2)-methyltransferase
MEEIRQHLPQGITLEEDGDGLFLSADGQILRADFTRMLPRLKPSNLNGELLVRAARIKGADGPLTALDATAGLGEDSLLLAAAGFSVTMYEWNPVVFALLRDGLRRAQQRPELAEIAGRMQVIHADSTEAMRTLALPPDVILLDPMFPERQKSALVKKKLQMIQKLEMPCAREGEILRTALEAGARKVIIKRPPKGPFLAGVKPDYSLSGKAVRFDCMVSPFDKKLQEWEKENG